jgi:hypothetical protein
LEVKKSIYVESTIPSYATARKSTNVVAAGRQYLTQFFWENQRHDYKLWVSQPVVDEISRGNAEAANRRRKFIMDIELLPKPQGLDDLAALYQKLLNIPERARTDCSHLAYCVLGRVDFLLTWNCGHLGQDSQDEIRKSNEKTGLWTPRLVTPEYFVIPKSGGNV